MWIARDGVVCEEREERGGGGGAVRVEAGIGWGVRGGGGGGLGRVAGWGRGRERRKDNLLDCSVSRVCLMFGTLELSYAALRKRKKGHKNSMRSDTKLALHNPESGQETTLGCATPANSRCRCTITL